eukprot:8096060-Karenia_brevis.AAC.1
MTLPDAENVPQPIDESIRRGYAAWLQSHTDRATRFLKYTKDSIKEAESLGRRPENMPVGYIALDAFGEGRRDHIVDSSPSTLVPNTDPSSYGARGSGSSRPSSSAIGASMKESLCQG